MSLHSRSNGKSLPIVLLAVAVVAVALLYFGGVIGGGAYDADDPDGSGGLDLLGADGEDDRAGAGDEENAGASLGGLYGAGDFGAIRMRLLRVGGAGDPVVGQEVRLLARSGEELTSMPSDPGGVVLFGEVRPAKGYQIRIQGEGFSEVHIRGISVHTDSTKDLGDLILGKDIVLRGRVVDAQGRPVPGTAVSVHTIERALATKGMLFTMAEQAGSVPFPLQAAESDQEGNFAFGALDDGQYTLVARHDGFASEHQGEVIVARERGAGVLTLVLGTAGRLVGVVSGPKGKPVAGAQIIAIRDTGMRMNSLEREMTVTDAKGEYVLDTLTAGNSYRLGVVAKGFAPVYTTQAMEIPEEDTERIFALVQGGDLEGVVTDEQTGEPIHNAKVAIYVGPMGWGRNRGGADERSVADTRITDEQGRFRFESIYPGPVSSSVVRAAGYASYTTSQWTNNLWPPVAAGETTEVSVTLKRGGTIRGFVRTRESKQPLQGAQVSVLQSGFAAMGAIWAGTPTAIAAADGGYEITGVLPGTYRLHTLADGYSSDGGVAGVEVEVPAGGGAVQKDLTMSTAGVVQGVVVDLAGDPIAGVRIRVRPGRDPEESRSETNRRRRSGGDWARNLLASGRSPVDLSDDTGAFQLDGVAAGAIWVVYGESDEYVSGETRAFKIAAGEVKKVRLMMLPGGTLRGRVVDDSGRGLAGARVQVGHLTDEMLNQTNLSSWEASRALGPDVYLTDEGGRFLATNLESGPAIVRAAKDGYVTFFKRNLTIRPGKIIAGYSVALTKGETVQGRVIGADGQPIVRATVAVTKQSNPGTAAPIDPEEGPSEDVEPMMFARTDDKGYYEVKDVKPGIYSVVVWMARGHKGWARNRDEAAIHREVVPPAHDQDFTLNKADPPGENPGGGNRRR